MKSRKFYEEQAIAHYKEIRDIIADCKTFADVEKVFEGHSYYECEPANLYDDDNYYDIYTNDEQFTIFCNDERTELEVNPHVEIFDEGDQIADVYLNDYGKDNVGVADAKWDIPDTYEIPAKIIFTGKVSVSAEDVEKAKEIVENNFRAMLDHCDNNGCDEIIDWEICMHSVSTEVVEFY